VNTGAGSDRRRWAAMPLIALGVAMIIVDATIVNVAVRVISGYLHIPEVGASETEASSQCMGVQRLGGNTHADLPGPACG
jgi:hypothetical protein